MNQPIEKKNKEELLKERRFILWVLFPTEELDAFWAHYIACYPEERKTLEEAKLEFKKVKLNAFRLSDIEKRKLKQHIEEKVNVRKQSRYRTLVWRCAVACILIIGMLIPLWLSDMPETDEIVSASSVSLEKRQTEVELLTNTQKVQLSNNTEICVNEEGNVQIPKEKIQSVEKQKSEKGDSEKEYPMNILKVPEGRRSFLTLSDGTKVWVNSGTVFQFPEQFDAKKRVVYVDGEIYLEVSKDVSRPFYVKTSQMDVKVLGTSFCVTAYKEEINQAVILREGSVMVDNRSGNKQQIRPDEMLVLANNQMEVKQVEAYDYISWIDGFLQFKQRELGSILDQLARYYRVEFTCPEDLKSLKCSGKLVLFDNVDQVLSTLQTTLSISYVREENQIQIK